MNILVLYATYSGGTMTASGVVRDTLSTLGHTVTYQDVHNQDPEILSPYDLVVLASPSWEYEGKDGHPHIFYMEFIKKAEGKVYSDKKFAILGLGDRAYPNFCGVADVLEAFVTSLQGKLVIPSLRIDGFFYKEEEYVIEITEWTKKLHETISQA